MVFLSIIITGFMIQRTILSFFGSGLNLHIINFCLSWPSFLSSFIFEVWTSKKLRRTFCFMHLVLLLVFVITTGIVIQRSIPVFFLPGLNLGWCICQTSLLLFSFVCLWRTHKPKPVMLTFLPGFFVCFGFTFLRDDLFGLCGFIICFPDLQVQFTSCYLLCLSFLVVSFAVASNLEANWILSLLLFAFFTNTRAPHGHLS